MPGHERSRSGAQSGGPTWRVQCKGLSLKRAESVGDGVPGQKPGERGAGTQGLGVRMACWLQCPLVSMPNTPSRQRRACKKRETQLKGQNDAFQALVHSSQDRAARRCQPRKQSRFLAPDGRDMGGLESFLPGRDLEIPCCEMGGGFPCLRRHAASGAWFRLNRGGVIPTQAAGQA